MRTCVEWDSFRVPPQPLKLVKRPRRRVEDVNDTVHVVEQRPTPLRETFRHIGRHASVLKPCLYKIGDGADVGIGCPTGNNKKVGHVRHTPKIEDHNVRGLQVGREGGGALGNEFAGAGGAIDHRDDRGESQVARGSPRRPEAIPMRPLKVARCTSD